MKRALFSLAAVAVLAVGLAACSFATAHAAPMLAETAALMPGIDYGGAVSLAGVAAMGVTASVSGASCEMPRYLCHKEVHALQIAAVDGNLLQFSDLSYGPLTVDDDYLAKHKPQQGGYYVVYPDGYKSFSPKDAFESGYTRRS